MGSAGSSRHTNPNATPMAQSAQFTGAEKRFTFAGDEKAGCCHVRRNRAGNLAHRVLIPRAWGRVWCDFGASILILSELLFVPDTALAMISSIFGVLLWYWYGPHLSGNLNR